MSRVSRLIRGRNYVLEEDEPAPPTLPAGDNLLDNSKLNGPTATTASDWEPDASNQGSVDFEDDVDDHRIMHCVDDTGTKRAAFQQFITVEAGVHTWSIECNEALDKTDAARAVTIYVAGVGTAVADFIDPRVTVGDLQPGQRHYARMNVTTPGTMLCRFGLGVPGGSPANIKISRPQIQKIDGPSEYDATDPAAEPPPPDPTLDPYRPWYGLAVGSFFRGGQNQVLAPGRHAQACGYLIKIPHDGTLDWMMHDITTRMNGEFTKSAKQGSWGTTIEAAKAHPFPVNWACTFRAYRTSPGSGDTHNLGTMVHEFLWTHKAQTGDPTLDSRVQCYFPCPISVTAGEILFVGIFNRESSPAFNYVVLNARGPSGNAVPAAGLSPPNRVDLFHGDYPVVARMDNGVARPGVNGGVTMQLGVCIHYANAIIGGQNYPGVMHGQVIADGTGSAHVSYIGGPRQVRTTLRTSVAMSVDRAIMAVTRHSSTNPGDNLYLDIVGPGVNATINIPASSVDYAPYGSSNVYRSQLFALGQTLNLQANVDYMATLRSPGSADTGYFICGGREATKQENANSATSRHMDPAPPSGWVKQTQHKGTGGGQRTLDGGATWKPASFDTSVGQADLPIALASTSWII